VCPDLLGRIGEGTATVADEDDVHSSRTGVAAAFDISVATAGENNTIKSIDLAMELFEDPARDVFQRRKVEATNVV